jgi:uncharacterized membrane protein YfcA
MLLAVGVLVGFISGFFGVGGGMILVPVLIYLGFGIKYAIGISVVQMAFSSLFGSFLNFKGESLKTLKIPIIIGVGGLIGAGFSGYILQNVSETFLTYLFLSIIVLSIFKSFITPSSHNKKPIINNFFLSLLGTLTGAVAISVGVGGAVIIRPVLVGFFHFPIKQTIKIALMFVVFSSLSGVVSLSTTGFVDFKNALIIGASSLVGVFFGIKAVQKVDNKKMKKYLIILDIVALSLILNKVF